jgi:hypothetical protein
MEREMYIYVYLDNRKPGRWDYKNIEFTHQPFYIGKGKNFRINHHLQPKNLNKNTIKNNIIKTIIKETDELPLHYKIFENLTFEESNTIEMDIIQHFGRMNLGSGILSNMTDGGEGFRNVIFTDETKKKMSNIAIGSKTYGNNGMSKIVEKYDLNDVFLESFNSLREASESIGKDFKNISSCCRGKSKTAYGFKWKYVGKSYNPPIKTESIEKRKKVYQYDLDGNYLKEYESQSYARRITKINHISCACLGKINFSGGYQWSYKKLKKLSPITFEKTHNINRYKNKK